MMKRPKLNEVTHDDVILDTPMYKKTVAYVEKYYAANPPKIPIPEGDIKECMILHWMEKNAEGGTTK
jgi:hypothetical protein